MTAGMLAAVKGRPVSNDVIAVVAERLEDAMRSRGTEVTSSEIGHAVLDELRELDGVAYMRFASVYKNFDDAADFRRELALLQKHANTARL
jgi:transcriptional repressor NrdR